MSCSIYFLLCCAKSPKDKLKDFGRVKALIVCLESARTGEAVDLTSVTSKVLEQYLDAAWFEENIVNAGVTIGMKVRPRDSLGATGDKPWMNVTFNTVG
jgi:hypothetical protein